MPKYTVWLIGFNDPTPEGKATFFEHLAARYRITPERAAASVANKNGVVFNVDDRPAAEQGRAFIESIGGIAELRENAHATTEQGSSTPSPRPASAPLTQPIASETTPDASREPGSVVHPAAKPHRPSGLKLTPGQPVRVVFRPLIEISFPGRCVGCNSTHPSEMVVLGVERATKMFTGRRVGMFGGGLIGGVVGTVAGGLASSFSGETSAYIFHVCSDCSARLTEAHRNALRGQGDGDLLPDYNVKTPILDRDLYEKCVILTFKNHDFGAVFVKWNEGLVFDSIENAKQSKARPFNESTPLFPLLGDEPIPPLSPQTPEFEAKILAILTATGPVDGILLGTDIPPDKLELVRTTTKAPARDRYLGLIDLTAFGSCKQAILVGTRGIHFPPCSSNATPFDCHLKYQDFVGRNFAKGTPHVLVLDDDRVLDISTSSAKKRLIVSILHAISQLITGCDPSRQTEPEAPEEQPVVESLLESPPPLHPQQPGQEQRPALVQDLKKLVRSLLAAHAGEPGLYLQGSIPDKKAMNARSKCQIPVTEVLLGLIDLTVFGSAKNCLVFGTRGIYFHNDMTGKSPGAFFVPYADFPHHDFGRESALELDMGQGASLNLAGADSEMKKAIPEILHQIKNVAGHATKP